MDYRVRFCRVCFYKGVGLAALAVRLDTRRPGQKLSDVPAHVAVALDGVLYQFISTGWQSRPATAADYAWSVPVTLTGGAGALAFAEGCRGERYDWLDIMAVAVSKLVPDKWLACQEVEKKHVCSDFVRGVLTTGGWPQPAYLAKQYVPISPNDLMLALRTHLATQVLAA